MWKDKKKKNVMDNKAKKKDCLVCDSAVFFTGQTLSTNQNNICLKQPQRRFPWQIPDFLRKTSSTAGNQHRVTDSSHACWNELIKISKTIKRQWKILISSSCLNDMKNSEIFQTNKFLRLLALCRSADSPNRLLPN